jgi:hypothetical protein
MKKSEKKDKARQNLGKRQLFAIVALVVVLVLLILWFFVGEGLVKQAEMARYLKSKYGEDFIVEWPEYKNGGLGIRGSWKSHAYPVSSPQLKFYIGCGIECSDDYLDFYFSEQEYSRLQQSMSSIGVTDYSIQLIIGDEALLNITKNTSLVDIKRKYDPIYKLRLKVVEMNSESQAVDNVMGIIEKIYNQGVSRIEVDYTLVSERKTRRCTTDYETVPRLTHENIKQCLKEE